MKKQRAVVVVRMLTLAIQEAAANGVGDPIELACAYGRREQVRPDEVRVVLGMTLADLFTALLKEGK